MVARQYITRAVCGASLLLLVGCAELQRPSAALHYDGVYYYRDGHFRNYLRFYPDGVVIDVVSNTPVTEATRWFRRDHGGMQGQFTITGSHITFSTSLRSPHALVEYTGEIVADQLALQWRSPRTREHGTSSYRFIPFHPKPSNQALQPTAPLRHAFDFALR